MNELLIDATNDNLDSVLAFIESELETKDCPMQLLMQIQIVVEEIFVNIANYAYNPDIGSVKIRVAVENDIVIEFEDDGTAYNPLEKEDPDITLDVQEREIGGLGIFIVKQIMDEVVYKHEGNKNILTVRKVLNN